MYATSFRTNRAHAFVLLLPLLFATAVLAENYIGCYVDDESRLLEALYVNDVDMTVAACKTICRGSGYTYSGVTNGTQCFCGNDIFKYGYELSPESECSMQCGGSWQQICGGIWRISVYQTTSETYKGCFVDKEVRFLDGAVLEDDEMTLDKCFSLCLRSGFLYAGTEAATWCFCGNDIFKDGYGFSPETECNFPCGGDPEEVCGGDMRLSVYMTKRDGYQGCFLDNEDRLLEATFMEDIYMTVEKCITFCSFSGYRYAGLEDESFCFCGNNIWKDGYEFRPESECSIICGGDCNDICGGAWRISVYKTRQSNYEGCYVDNEARLIDGKYIDSNDMTIKKCVANCGRSGFTYAGLEDWTQCFCGNDISKEGYGLALESECNYPCSGDPQEICGGPWRLSIYRTRSDNYIGCYVDMEERLLGAMYVDYAYMTVEICDLLCSRGGYMYAGLEDYTQCFCGDDIFKDGYGLSPETECNYYCGGDRQQMCGGPWRLSVYRTKDDNYKGCYIDQELRLLDALSIEDIYMTVYKCLTACNMAGYGYAGVRNKTICSCGNEIMKDGYEYAPESECSSTCGWNYQQICGSAWAMAVYETKIENYFGCYIDQDVPLLETLLLDDALMTVERCISACSKAGYIYSGLQAVTLCFCGDTVFKDGYGLSQESECSSPCGGNGRQMCGGTYRLSVYKTRIGNYRGCFIDQEIRLLDAFVVDDMFMTVDKCLMICSRGGYPYAGFEDKTQCYCGFDYLKDGYDVSPISDCSETCGWDFKQICGGDWTISVYGTRPENYVGCYVDQETRLLDGFYVEDPYMTVKKCFIICSRKGFLYAGLEDSAWCFCGNDIKKDGYGRAPESECNYPCEGDHLEVCGGGWRLSIYRTRTENNIGCYVDTEDRLLDGVLIEEFYMTVPGCLTACSKAGFMYAGVEDKTQCRCGNNVMKEGFAFSPEYECSQTCGWNGQQICGGPWTIAVYQTKPDNYVGCHIDMDVPLLDALVIEDKYMSLKKCLAICRRSGYKYAGAEAGYFCFCGNNIYKDGYGVTLETECSTICGGNIEQICGGDLRISVYRTKPDNYVACYVDNEDRLLGDAVLEDEFMTLDICIQFCLLTGYMYAGAEDNTFCFCGNTLMKDGYEVVDETECLSACGGNAEQICGGSWRLSVYKTKPEFYQGCYIDTDVPLLEALIIEDEYMTIKRCKSICGRSGYLYSGNGGGTMCSCGNTLYKDGYGVAPETECNAVCGGDAVQICGGDLRLSVYRTKPDYYIGCYVDLETPLLDALGVEESFMTIDRCMDICNRAGYRYAGEENGNLCFCGNNIYKDGYGIAPEIDCGTPCGGNPSEVCGGPLRVSVYRTKPENYIACYIDMEDRFLPDAVLEDEFMTLDKCMTFCLISGYQYFGAEDSTFCFCGDNIMKEGYGYAEETDCSSSCGGNVDQICGGGWRLSVYRTKPSYNLGCYIDLEVPFLETLLIDDIYMTVDECRSMCSVFGALYAGLESGTVCFCGNTVIKDGYELAPETECSTFCGGNSQQICGGELRLSLYRTKPDNYMGCYTDNEVRFLEGELLEDAYMTVDKCLEFCVFSGWSYAGMQDGSLCFCGNDISKQGYGLASESECITPCGGDPKQLCGGSWRLSLYRTKEEGYKGCFVDLEDRLLDGLLVDNNDMTVKNCLYICNKAGYLYAGLEASTLCFCGVDIFKEGYGHADETECSAPCGGDRLLACGGPLRLSVYTTKPGNYKGCYIDDEARLLEALSIENVFMTIETCLRFCMLEGYRYAGLQSGTLCSCGNSLLKDGYGWGLESECSVPCAGNPEQLCGGDWRLSVYMTKQDHYRGCYVDSEDRLLEALYVDESDMTVEKCLFICRLTGYRFAGLSDGSLCLCGNDISKDGYGLAPETECSSFCVGNPLQLCGGSFRLSVYSTKAENYKGCYFDSDIRLLDGVFLDDLYMTVEKCVEFCLFSGFEYAGLQATTLCFCGNELWKDGYDYMDELECNAPCGGNFRQICGGDWRLSVYQTKLDSYEGCYTDSEARLLEDLVFDYPDMTVEFCMQLCRSGGYKYAGLQAESLCFCGSNLWKDGYAKSFETECSAPCGGNRLQICGGLFRLSVYRTLPDNYLGCYIDNEVRLLDGEFFEDVYMNVNPCLRFCLMLGYMYAGLQSGVLCYCGNNIFKDGYGFGPELECSAPCGGDPRQICGGDWRLSVYKVRQDNYEGCFIDDDVRLLDAKIVESNDMSIEKCLTICRWSGYLYAGLQESILCFCGDNLFKEGYGLTADIECFAPCAGDRLQVCGGIFRLSVYRTKADNYRGCYVDNEARLFEADLLEDPFMSVDICLVLCMVSGYTYAGLQEGIFCFCGDDLWKEGYGGTPEVECSSVCAGNHDQFCGGPWRLSVYQVKRDDYKGCYIDDEARFFEEIWIEDMYMTVDKCLSSCRNYGYLYAGTQESIFCSCGNKLWKEGYGIRPESECSYVCRGNPQQICGGVWRMSVYQTRPDHYKGCYVDAEERLLEAIFYEDLFMTIDKCVIFCLIQGYRFAGLQASTMCFCGNDHLKGGYGLTVDTECSAPCGGNLDQFCGGEWRLSIFQAKRDNYKGCYIDMEDRLLGDKFVEEIGMNVDKCIIICNRAGYKYAGLQESIQCYCGDSIMKEGYSLSLESECNLVCGGSLEQICGGSLRLSVYQTRPDNYQGCVIDDEALLLDGEFFEDMDMTVGGCTRFCLSTGFIYAGLRGGIQCYCGNTMMKEGYAFVPETECFAICGGNPEEMCGGDWRLSVYRTKRESYLGCYVDKPERLLAAKFVSGQDMTVDVCLQICSRAGYYYAGVEWSIQCFCGNDVSKEGYGSSPESECNHPCSGDPLQICGGNWRLSVYRTKADNYMGCYIDMEARLLEASVVEDVYMTVDKCIVFCMASGWGYAGLQAGIFCYCGDDAMKDGYGLGEEAECFFPCGGYFQQICGGIWRLSVYKTKRDNYQGCYVDDEARLLEGAFIEGPDMSIDFCLMLCRDLGFGFAGLERSYECYCGNDIAKEGYGLGSESECSSPCSGNTQHICGGEWRLSVYIIVVE